METIKKATSLQTAILCANTLNAHCIEIIKHETPFFTSLIGINPFKVDGSFKSKYPHTTKDFNRTKINHLGFDFWIETYYYITNNHNKITLNIITSVWGGGYDRNGVNLNSNQQTRQIELAVTSPDGTILELKSIDLDSYKCEYVETDILNAAKLVEDAKKQYQDAVSKIPYRFKDILYIKSIY